MFTSIVNWVKFQLLLHVPLWIFGLAFLGLIFLPEETRRLFILPLLFTYILSRYVWRRYLKKQGKLGNASSGLFSLIFWGVIGAAAFYAWVTPHPPDLAVYASGAEPHEDSKVHLTGKHGGKKSFLGHVLQAEKEAVAQSLACQYAKQEKLLNDCASNKSFELDNDPETREVLVLEGDPYTCEKADCRLWLIQIPPEQLAVYNAAKEKDPEAELSVVSAKNIANWDKVLPPIQIGAGSTSGWRLLQIPHANGEFEQWRQAEAGR